MYKCYTLSDVSAFNSANRAFIFGLREVVGINAASKEMSLDPLTLQAA